MAYNANDLLGMPITPLSGRLSFVRVQGPNSAAATGHVSAMYIPVVGERIGADVDVGGDSVQGTIFNIRTSGWYLLSVSMCHSGAVYWGFVKDVITGNLLTVAESARLVWGRVAASTPTPISGVAYLPAGSQIKIVCDGGSPTPASPTANGAVDQWASVARIG